MVNLYPLEHHNSRITPYLFQQKIIHAHRLLTDNHLVNKPSGQIYQHTVSAIYPENIEIWFKPMLPIMSHYLGVMLKMVRILLPGHTDPIKTISIVATTKEDTIIAAHYVRLMYSYMKQECIHQKRNYARKKRKERRAIRKGRRAPKKKYVLTCYQHMVAYRKKLISDTQEYMLEFMIEGQEEIFPSAILIKNQKLQILRRIKKATPIWRKHTP